MWAPPKTNWTPEPIIDTDLNRIEGNIAYLHDFIANGNFKSHLTIPETTLYYASNILGQWTDIASGALSLDCGLNVSGAIAELTMNIEAFTNYSATAESIRLRIGNYYSKSITLSPIDTWTTYQFSHLYIPVLALPCTVYIQGLINEEHDIHIRKVSDTTVFLNLAAI